MYHVCASSGCNYKYKYRWESSPHWKPSKGKGGINVTYNVIINGNILFLTSEFRYMNNSTDQYYWLFVISLWYVSACPFNSSENQTE